MPTNLQLLEKANRAAHLFNEPSTALVGRAARSAADAQVGPVRKASVTFRFQPQFLDLAQQLLAPKPAGETFSLGICPARGQDPVGRFIAYFASSISQMAKAPVLLIETNFRRPSLAKHLGARSTPGFHELLTYTGKARLECIHSTRYENLHLLPAGVATSKDPRNLQRAFDRLYKLVANEYQSVIIAYPAWDEIPAARSCYATADAMLLAVRPGACGALTLRRAIRRLRSKKAKLIGSVLSSVEH